MRLSSPYLREALAAEYVLGTLTGPARTRFTHLMTADVALQNAVKAWEQRLNPLGEVILPVDPPARIWDHIQARLMPSRKVRYKGLFRAWLQALWSHTGFWRGVAFANLAAALVLAIVLVLLWTHPAMLFGPSPVYVVVVEQ